MKILHVCNWCSGITTRNINALKQFSKHSHEFVTRITHPYSIDYEAPTYTEAATAREVVLALAEEAEAIHFWHTGWNGSAGLPETIHGIDWSVFRGKKPFILTGHCSNLLNGGTSWLYAEGLSKFAVSNLEDYDAIFGPHLSCRYTYDKRLQYAPDIIPINDWLYTPASGNKPHRVCSFKCMEVVNDFVRGGIQFDYLPTPMKMAAQLAQRRTGYKVTADNVTDGHWGLFGMESLSQGVPCATYIHPLNLECFDILGVPHPPFLPVEYGGGGIVEQIKRVFGMPNDEYAALRAECRNWIERFYNPELLVRRYDDLYSQIR